MLCSLAKKLIVPVAFVAGTMLFVGSPAPAHAQGLFDALIRAFGGGAPVRQQSGGNQTLAYGAPTSPFGDPLNPQFPPATRPLSSGRTTFCVRTCDGRYFPMTMSGQATPAKACSAMFPASATKVFSGGSIDDASANDGKRYSDLGNAFVYRTKLVDGCTCNGKDPAGLAQIDVNKDPTMRAGDVVATKDGMKVFRGAPSDTHKAADFTPLENARMPDSERRKLVSIKVTPRFDRPAFAQP